MTLLLYVATGVRSVKSIVTVPFIQFLETFASATQSRFSNCAATALGLAQRGYNLVINYSKSEAEALASEAFYIGGIGSRRNNEARRARMIEHFDQTEESLARLRGPIGIYIGSKTPPEIAVSVMAEILAVKNGVTLPRDMEVAQAKNDRELAHNDPGALVCGVRAA